MRRALLVAIGLAALVGVVTATPTLAQGSLDVGRVPDTAWRTQPRQETTVSLDLANVTLDSALKAVAAAGRVLQRP